MTNKWTHSGNIIVAVFICAAISMCFLVYACMRQRTDMVSENYYEQELGFQQNIDARRNALPFAKDFTITSFGDSLSVHLPPSLSGDLELGAIDFYCASDSRQDKHIKLLPNPLGRYSIGTTSWPRLPFLARISFTNGNKKYYNELQVNL